MVEEQHQRGEEAGGLTPPFKLSCAAEPFLALCGCLTERREAGSPGKGSLCPRQQMIANAKWQRTIATALMLAD